MTMETRIEHPLPLGFKFSGVACGIKESGSLDLGLIVTEADSVMAGVYTQNVVRAASVDWNRDLTPTDQFRAVVINSGNANACTGEQGVADNLAMAEQVASLVSAEPAQVCVMSTGIIGHHLPMPKIKSGISDASNSLAHDPSSFQNVVSAIQTTDKFSKTASHEVTIGENKVRITGMAKGAGMIGPNMATMLSIIMTDAALTPGNAQAILTRVANRSFNCISVEGHTSTNDCLILICSGHSKTQIITEQEIAAFEEGLQEVCVPLAKMIPMDGEGATHLITINVNGAQSDRDADQVARTVAASNLVKTAITGADPNWGRIVSAAGYAGVPMEIESTKLCLNGHTVFDSGQPVSFEASVVSQSIEQSNETVIELWIGPGAGTATHWTSDLTTEYVRFNSEYST